MFLALDIETMADAARVANLPEPSPKKGLVDPVKIMADIADKRAEQLENAAKSPMTGRVICVGLCSGTDSEAKYREATALPECTDACERNLLQYVFGIIADAEVRLVTFNGNQFDLPFIYRRAMMLGVSPKNFGAPPLNAWTKRYDNARHIDMFAVWTGGASIAEMKGNGLKNVAPAVLGEGRDDEDYQQFPTLMQTQEGRAHIEAACLHHTELTFRIFERAQGCLFA